jgi:hypothetical protein
MLSYVDLLFGKQHSVDGMEFDRCAPLRIGDMDVGYRCRNHAMAEYALHFGQVDSCFQADPRRSCAGTDECFESGLVHGARFHGHRC